MSIEPYYMLKMQRCETQLRKELAREQVSHPLSDYTEERVERLLAQVAQQQRWTSPETITFNV